MHTHESDGHNSIQEMAEAARARGLRYIAITEHSKNLAMARGLDEKRALEHLARIREADHRMEGRIRIFTGIEVDILGDGAVDLDNEVLAQMDVVIASVHSRFDQTREEMTARVLRAIENPYVKILGHPTGRQILRREPFAIDLAVIFKRAAELGIIDMLRPEEAEDPVRLAQALKRLPARMPPSKVTSKLKLDGLENITDLVGEWLEPGSQKRLSVIEGGS